MKLMKKKHILWLLPVCSVMIIIFLFSSQSGDQSSNGSNYLADRIVTMIDKFQMYIGKENITDVEIEQFSVVTFLVRKAAHITEYTILGICLANFFYQIKCTRKKILLGSIVSGFLYAVSDEIHQYFVPGRSCEFRDVCIDTFGVLLGIFIVLLFIRKRKLQKYKS